MSGSDDITDSDLASVEIFAATSDCDPMHALGCWMAESGLYTWAHNPNGHASGIFQAMPAILKGMGFDPLESDQVKRAEHFRQLSFRDQVRWAGRYYRPYIGKLTSRAAFYVATFLPADLDYAAMGNRDTVLSSVGGRRGWAYAANAGFDRNGDLAITVGELEDAIVRACHGPRWNSIEQRMLARLRRSSMPSQPMPGPMDLTTTRGIQEALVSRGFDPGPIDGIPGPRTRSALLAFQTSAGLDPDGIPGPRTRAALSH